MGKTGKNLKRARTMPHNPWQGNGLTRPDKHTNEHAMFCQRRMTASLMRMAEGFGPMVLTHESRPAIANFGTPKKVGAGETAICNPARESSLRRVKS